MSKVAAKVSQALVTVGEETQKTFSDVQDYSLDTDRGTIDVSSLDSDWKEFLTGQIEWGGSLKLFYDPADATAQAAVEQAMFDGVQIELVFRPAGAGVGLPEYTGNAFVTKWAPAGAREDAVGVSLTFKGTGALVRSAQSV